MQWALYLKSPQVISHYSHLGEVNKAVIPVHHTRIIILHVLHMQLYLTGPLISLCIEANSLTDESAEDWDTSEDFLLVFCDILYLYSGVFGVALIHSKENPCYSSL